MVGTGTRLQVWKGDKHQTSDGLKKSDIKKNKAGRLVSKKVSNRAKQNSNLKGFLIRPRGTRKRRKPKRYAS